MTTEILAVALKEIRQTRRDPRTLAVLVVAPLMQLILLGFAVNLDVTHVPVVLADADQTAESRAFAEALLAGETFEAVAALPDPEAAAAEVIAGRAAIALIIPPGFAAALRAGRAVDVQALADGSDAQRAVVAQNTLTAFAARWSLAYSAATGQAPRFTQAPVEIRPRVLYNPTLNSRVFFVPGVAATLLLVVTLVVTAMGLAREKEDGTLEQILVTPISSEALMLGKVLPYGLIGLFDLALAVTLGAAIFGVPLRGALPIVGLGGALYMLTTLGLGLFVASAARTQQQAFMGAFFLILPMTLLSGFMSPISNMPAWLQPLTLLDPMRHMVEILRGVLLKGASLADLAPQLLWLAGMGLTVFTAAAVALRKRLA
ncbi:ABC transporter permease [Myxococcota bacterium]|nr:ABC transporter permease [Myxococcota bacterium]MBU1898069.1 ABC transporter permease [Myxococcota bacterium]